MTSSLFPCQKNRSSISVLGLSLFLALGCSPACHSALADNDTPPQTFKEFEQLALKTHNTSDYDGARQLFLQALDAAQTNDQKSRAQEWIGIEYSNLKNYSEARKWFDKIIQNQESPEVNVGNAYGHRSITYMEEKNYQAAEAAAKEMLRDPRVSANARGFWWTSATQSYMDDGKFAEAYRILATALADKEQQPSYHQTFENYLKSVQQQEQEKTGRVSSLPSPTADAPATANQPVNPIIGNPETEDENPGRAYLPFDDVIREANKLAIAKDKEGARRLFLQALEMAPNTLEHCRTLLSIAGTYESFPDQRIWWNKMLAVKGIPKFLASTALVSLAGSYLSEENFPEGIKAAQRVLQDPRTKLGDWCAAWSIADSCFSRQGMYAESIQVLEEALAEPGLEKQWRDQFTSSLSSTRRMLADEQKQRRN